MKIEGSYTFNAPREKVWQVLLDPKIMAQCMPGCEKMSEIGPDQYEATMKVGVASVKGTYKGKVAIKEKQAPFHYVLSGEGSGGPGFMQGDVSIDLAENNGHLLYELPEGDEHCHNVYELPECPAEEKPARTAIVGTRILPR